MHILSVPAIRLGLYLGQCGDVPRKLILSVPVVIESDSIPQEALLITSQIYVVINSIQDEQISVIIGTLVKEPAAGDA